MFNNNSSASTNSILEYRQLPQAVLLPESLGADACSWLDDYNAFSRTWSPRSFDGFHEAVGLGILSIIAARRVVYDFGKRRFTNLAIALVARTSIAAKSSAANIGKDLLRAAGLDFFLLPDSCTPQKLVNLMTLQTPSNYERLADELKEKEKHRLAFISQRGWFIDEFGGFISGMMQLNGPLAEFRGLIRRFDDNEDTLENATIKRGNEVIKHPYLTMVVCLPPANLQNYAKTGSALWNDGFLARFAIVAPNSGFVGKGRFPKGQRIFPQQLIEPLQNWHKSLGIPVVQISNANITVSDITPHVIALSEEVYEATYGYGEALLEMSASSNNTDLDGNYSRYPEKALRVAAIFASFSGSSSIELNHYARAQNITERWRKNEHDLYHQLNGPDGPLKLTTQQKVLRCIDRKGIQTKREIVLSTGLDYAEVQNSLDELLDTKEIVMESSEKTARYTRINRPGLQSLSVYV